MKHFDIKEGLDSNDLMLLTPAMLYFLSSFTAWAKARELPVVITSMVTDPVKERVSDSHHHGRAVDVSVRGWTPDDIEAALKHFNNEFKDIAAISYSDLKPRAIVYHSTKNGAYHFHLQVKHIDYTGLDAKFWTLEKKKTRAFLSCLTRK